MNGKPVSRENAEHYRWGGAKRDKCDGWFLLRTSELAIIEEAMPPGASETRHYHVYARQFFYVLEGMLTMEMAGTKITLRAHQGVEIDPGESHRALNSGEGLVRFLVTSQPPSQGDRVEVDL